MKIGQNGDQYPAMLEREMGCTPRDFARWLPGATRGAPVDTVTGSAGTVYILSVGDGKVEIEISDDPPRRIAGIVLPVLRVQFRFLGLDAAQRADFLSYFDHYTRRGGG